MLLLGDGWADQVMGTRIVLLRSFKLNEKLPLMPQKAELYARF